MCSSSGFYITHLWSLLSASQGFEGLRKIGGFQDKGPLYQRPYIIILWSTLFTLETPILWKPHITIWEVEGGVKTPCAKSRTVVMISFRENFPWCSARGGCFQHLPAVHYLLSAIRTLASLYIACLRRPEIVIARAPPRAVRWTEPLAPVRSPAPAGNTQMSMVELLREPFRS